MPDSRPPSGPHADLLGQQRGQITNALIAIDPRGVRRICLLRVVMKRYGAPTRGGSITVVLHLVVPAGGRRSPRRAGFGVSFPVPFMAS